MSSLYYNRKQHLLLDETILNEGNGHRWFTSHRWEINHSSGSELKRMGYDEVTPINPYYAEYLTIFNCKCGAKMIRKNVMAIG